MCKFKTSCKKTGGNFHVKGMRLQFLPSSVSFWGWETPGVTLGRTLGQQVNLKPRPNDRNMPTQHIATLLGATCCVRAFSHPVASCCDVLGVVGSNLTIFKPEPTTPNMFQHIATRWPNARNMLRPTMLRCVALTCCDRLAGA